MNNNSIQDVFQLLDRDIWIVTSSIRDGNDVGSDIDQSSSGDSVAQPTAKPHQGGLVATWVNQASVDAHHPSVVIGIAANHYTSDLIDRSSAFGLHLLLPQQTDVALKFAIGSGRDHEKLSGIASHTVETGSPILDECLAWLDCQVYYRFNGGDRVYYFADVVAGEKGVAVDSKPLRESQLIAAATDEQRAALKESLDSDVLKQRPKLREWREQLGDHPHPKFS